MMTVEEALRNMLKEISLIRDIETVSLMGAMGRIAAEDCVVRSPVPAFPRSAMDGYAVRSADTAGASFDVPARLKVTGRLMAGDYTEIPAEAGAAARVMTGAFVPRGFDAVVKQEDTDLGEKEVSVFREIRPYENYCLPGENMKEGFVPVKAGDVIGPLAMGLLAASGQDKVKVIRRPRVSVISTGNELQSPGETPLLGKIYDSVGYMLAGAAAGCLTEVKGPYMCKDEPKEARRLIGEALDWGADMVITTGAISVGEKDFIPELLSDMGARTIFRKAEIQPGTPTMASALDNRVILSLSGNPYAALANFEIYFREAVAAMTGCQSLAPQRREAVLADRYDKVNRLRRLIRAREEDGKVYLPEHVHSSSVTGNLLGCNCMIDLEAGRSVRPGDRVRIIRLSAAFDPVYFR